MIVSKATDIGEDGVSALGLVEPVFWRSGSRQQSMPRRIWELEGVVELGKIISKRHFRQLHRCHVLVKLSKRLCVSRRDGPDAVDLGLQVRGLSKSSGMADMILDININTRMENRLAGYHSPRGTQTGGTPTAFGLGCCRMTCHTDAFNCRTSKSGHLAWCRDIG